MLLPRALRREQYLKECISDSGILNTNKGFTASHPFKKFFTSQYIETAVPHLYTQGPWLISVSLELNVLHSCKSCGERLNQRLTTLVEPQLPDSGRHRAAAGGTSRLLPWFPPRQPRGQPGQPWRPCPPATRASPSRPVRRFGDGGRADAATSRPPSLAAALSPLPLPPGHRPQTLPRRLGRGRP